VGYAPDAARNVMPIGSCHVPPLAGEKNSDEKGYSADFAPQNRLLSIF
jgi:hypothetical protein